MLDHYKVVNPTGYVVGHDLPSQGDDNWHRAVWEGDRTPSQEELRALSTDSSVFEPYEGYDPHGRGWLQTRPSEKLIVKQQRGVKLGRISLPLGWRRQYETTISELAAA